MHSLTFALAESSRAGVVPMFSKILLTVVVVLFAWQTAAADRANGRRIAERWCSQCHVIARGQRVGSDGTPTFAQIRQSGRFDKVKLAVFLSAPHASRMQDLALSRSEIADLVDYIKNVH